MDKLSMTFEANTIKHLGVKMYSHLPPALAELIANAYDACATTVKIFFYDGDEKRIVVEDDGVGMSFNEVNNYFLKIGRNRREENQKSPCGRVPTGKKGLGKLALFGIGDTIDMTTSQGGEIVSFKLDWQEIQEWKGSDYEPSFDVSKSDSTTNGTTITLTNLKRKTDFPVNEYAESIAKLFDFKDEFKVILFLNDEDPIEIDGKSKFDNVTPEFEWDIKDIIAENENEYENRSEITGTIITTEKPLKANMRGVTLFANGRMVNGPEFFGPSESSHFFSYATGWLNVDFIDNWEDDVISTNRQSIDWDQETTARLRQYIVSCISIVERQWRERRKERKKAELVAKAQLDVGDWLGKLPQRVQGQVESFVNLLDDTPELSEETQQQSIQLLHDLVPEYADFHWRHLHNEIQDASKADYQNTDYYRAFIEAMKRYIASTRKKSASTNATDGGMMGEVFGRGKVLNVSAKYKKPDGTDFTLTTLENIEEGQKFMSMGILAGGRNTVSHEEIVDLRESGLFSEMDCLDALSLLSHLIRRLDDA